MPRRRVIPEITMEVAVSVLNDRDLNRLSRAAMSEAVLEHYDKNIRKHFRAGNRFRYQHYPRSRRYIAYKRRTTGQQVDLVKSRRSANFIPNNRSVRISGSATTGNFAGHVDSYWPFRGGKTGKTRGTKGRADGINLTVVQLSEEVENWANDEIRPAMDNFRDKFVASVQDYLLNRRKHKYKVTI